MGGDGDTPNGGSIFLRADSPIGQSLSPLSQSKEGPVVGQELVGIVMIKILLRSVIMPLAYGQILDLNCSMQCN